MSSCSFEPCLGFKLRFGFGNLANSGVTLFVRCFRSNTVTEFVKVNVYGRSAWAGSPGNEGIAGVTGTHRGIRRNHSGYCVWELRYGVFKIEIEGCYVCGVVGQVLELP